MIKDVKLKVVGVTFKNEEDGTKRQDILDAIVDTKELLGGFIRVKLVREPFNAYDKNAVAVVTEDPLTSFDEVGKKLGYIGRDYAEILAPMMDEGKLFNVKISECAMYKNRYFCEILLNEVELHD